VTGDAAHTMEQAVALHTGESDEDGIVSGQHIIPDSCKNLKSVCIKSCCANFGFVCGLIRTTTLPFCVSLSKCFEKKNSSIISCKFFKIALTFSLKYVEDYMLPVHF